MLQYEIDNIIKESNITIGKAMEIILSLIKENEELRREVNYLKQSNINAKA